MLFFTLTFPLLFQITHQSSVDIPKAKLYIAAFLRDLEILTDPPPGTNSPYDPSDYSQLRETFLHNLLEEVKRSQESLEKLETISIFNQMVDLYSKVTLQHQEKANDDDNKLPALSLPSPKALTYGAPCNPLYHFAIPADDIMEDSLQPQDFYPQVQEWLKLASSSSSPDFAVCDTHLGLICSKSTYPNSPSAKCSCQPKTKWITPPGKCFLSPDSPCTFLNLHLQTAHFTHLHSPSWFLSRVFVFPVASPTCGDGLVCDSVRDRNTLTPTCLCTDKSSRNRECTGKSTWAESESLSHKISKLIIEVEQPCSPPSPEIDAILQALSGAAGNGKQQPISPEKAEELKAKLVQNGGPICDYENFEWCSPDLRLCLRTCPLPGQTHDPHDSFKCKFNYAEKCVGRNKDECISHAICTKVNWSKDSTCLCRNTYETANLTIRDYFYGSKCSRKPKSFWLRLFQPFKSGLSGDNFIKKEMELDTQLKVIEQLTTLEKNSTCDLPKDMLALKTLSYIGNNLDLVDSSYETDLKRVSEYNATTLLCNHKNFLACNRTTNSCLPLDDRFFWNNETKTLHYGEAQNCIQPAPSKIPKVFYHPFNITCTPNSFCVIDLSKNETWPDEIASSPAGLGKINATCRCRRHFTGQFCTERRKEVKPYNSIEQAKLESLLKMIDSQSGLKHGDNCSLDVEESLDNLKILPDSSSSLENVDLYYLYYTLSQVSTKDKLSKGPFPDLFKLKAEFGLCNKHEFLKCTLSPSESLEEEPQAFCDCAPGLELKLGKCYISDGAHCGTHLHEVYNISCASGKCSPSSTGESYCDEDFTYRYVVPLSTTKNSGSYHHRITANYIEQKIVTFMATLMTFIISCFPCFVPEL